MNVKGEGAHINLSHTHHTPPPHHTYHCCRIIPKCDAMQIQHSFVVNSPAMGISLIGHKPRILNVYIGLDFCSYCPSVSLTTFVATYKDERLEEEIWMRIDVNKDLNVHTGQNLFIHCRHSPAPPHLVKWQLHIFCCRGVLPQIRSALVEACRKTKP